MLDLPLLAAALLGPQLSNHEWVPVDGPIFPADQAAYDAGRGRLVVLGTEGGTWEFDGDTRLQRANLGSSGPGWRSRGSMAADPERGLTLLFGGTTGPAAFPPYLGDTWLWDGSSWTPGVGAVSPPDRIYGVMGFDAGRGCFVLYGGQVEGGLSNDTWEYDANGWREVQTANSPKSSRGWMAYDSARGVLVMLSSPGIVGRPLLVDEYDGSDWTSRPKSGSWPTQRSNMSVAYDEARQVTVMIGGSYNGEEIWEWDGDAWSLAHLLAEPWRINAPAYYDAALGAVVAVGGSTSTSTGSSLVTYTDAHTWDGTTFAKRREDHSPSIRSDSVLFADPVRGKLVLGAGTPLDETWEWDGNSWTEIQGTPGPPTRQFASSTFDTARGVGLVFGGRRGTNLDELWSWDGSDWTELPSTTRPSPRFGVGLAFDTARAKAVLYGGAYSSGFVLNLLRGTWEWDGAEWTKNTDTTSFPSARMHPGMVHDPDRDLTVLFGGLIRSSSSGIVYANDTWEYDGLDWSQASPGQSPPPLEDPTLVHDPVRSRVVLVGVNDGGAAPMIEVWEYDGSTWTLLDVTPDWVGSNLEVAWDPERQRVMAYDGWALRTWTGTAAGAATYGAGCGSNPLPMVRTRARLGDEEFGFEARVAPGQPTLFAFGLGTASTPVGGGCTLLVRPLRWSLVTADSFGTASLVLGLRDDISYTGITLRAQAGVVDYPPTGQWGLTRGMAVVLGD